MVTRVCCFYAQLHPDTRAAVELWAPGAEFVETEYADVLSFTREFLARWEQPGDLVVIEERVVIREGVIAELDACPEPWCGFTYPGRHPTIFGTLACVRFREGLRRAVAPDLIRRAYGACDQHAPRSGCHHQLSNQVTSAVRHQGFMWHTHQPPVVHIERDPSPDAAWRTAP